MSTLKVNKLRDTAGSADAITLDPNGGAVLAGVTTVTSVKVGLRFEYQNQASKHQVLESLC